MLRQKSQVPGGGGGWNCFCWRRRSCRVSTSISAVHFLFDVDADADAAVWCCCSKLNKYSKHISNRGTYTTLCTTALPWCVWVCTVQQCFIAIFLFIWLPLLITATAAPVVEQCCCWFDQGSGSGGGGGDGSGGDGSSHLTDWTWTDWERELQLQLPLEQSTSGCTLNKALRHYLSLSLSLSRACNQKRGVQLMCRVDCKTATSAASA